jgi:hypothetical protein
MYRTLSLEQLPQKHSLADREMGLIEIPKAIVRRNTWFAAPPLWSDGR